MVPSDKTRGNGHKPKYRKFWLNMRNLYSFTVRVTKHWNRLPRVVVESLSLEIVKTRLDAILCNAHCMTLLGWGVGPDDLQRYLPTSAIL